MDSIFEKFKLNGQVAIVTGGAGMLGREFSRTLAQAGAQVIVADSDIHNSNHVVKKISNQGLLAHASQVDVTDPDSVQKLVEDAINRFERIDILVCSAAIDPKFESKDNQKHVETFEEFPLLLWKQSLDVNLTGVFLCAQECGKRMLQQKHGVMVLICSTYGLVGPDQRIYQKGGAQMGIKPVPYSVTKAGILGLTHYLAAYYSGKNIRVNALTPGGVYNKHEEEFVERYSSRTIIGRMARKEEMNGALLFLATEASSYMTGANLVVDGGWTAW